MVISLRSFAVFWAAKDDGARLFCIVANAGFSKWTKLTMNRDNFVIGIEKTPAGCRRYHEIVAGLAGRECAGVLRFAQDDAHLG
jgi:hypothetical protein